MCTIQTCESSDGQKIIVPGVEPQYQLSKVAKNVHVTAFKLNSGHFDYVLILLMKIFCCSCPGLIKQYSPKFKILVLKLKLFRSLAILWCKGFTVIWNFDFSEIASWSAYLAFPNNKNIMRSPWLNIKSRSVRCTCINSGFGIWYHLTDCMRSGRRLWIAFRISWPNWKCKLQIRWVLSSTGEGWDPSCFQVSLYYHSSPY